MISGCEAVDLHSAVRSDRITSMTSEAGTHFNNLECIPNTVKRARRLLEREAEEIGANFEQLMHDVIRPAENVDDRLRDALCREESSALATTFVSGRL